MGAQLSVRQVRHLRGGREVLRVDGLDVAPGEHVGVLGPNGAGKSTLLRLIAGVDRPDAGVLTVDGIRTDRGGVDLRRRVAFATQQAGLLSTSVRHNVELPLRWRKVPRARRRDLADAALERLKVAHLAERPARALSGGEQQRVSLARALALDPAVLLLDEPAAGLDTQTRSTFLADLERALADRATTVVHVSHRAEEALRLADRVVVLVEGRLRQAGTPQALNRHPADASVAGLVGYENLVRAFVDEDGAVLVGGAPTGLVCRDRRGPVTVAVFANGVRPVTGEGPGVPLEVRRVSPGPGYQVVAMEGAAALRAHLPVETAVPVVGDSVRVVLEPMLSAVLPVEPGAGGAPDSPAPSRVEAME
jgi:ABC-type sulfate/molybdate transport systems ATPase subunit